MWNVNGGISHHSYFPQRKVARDGCRQAEQLLLDFSTPVFRDHPAPNKSLSHPQTTPNSKILQLGLRVLKPNPLQLANFILRL